MPATPDDIAAAFEKRLEKMEKQIVELQGRSTWVIRDSEGNPRVVIGNLAPVAGIFDYGIAVYDDEDHEWHPVQFEEE